MSYYFMFYLKKHQAKIFAGWGRGLRLKALMGCEGKGKCHTFTIRKDTRVAVPGYRIQIKFSRSVQDKSNSSEDIAYAKSFWLNLPLKSS